MRGLNQAFWDWLAQQGFERAAVHHTHPQMWIYPPSSGVPFERAVPSHIWVSGAWNSAYDVRIEEKYNGELFDPNYLPIEKAYAAVEAALVRFDQALESPPLLDIKPRRLTNSSDSECPISGCERDAYAYGCDELDGYVESCGHHAKLLLEDAIGYGSSR